MYPLCHRVALIWTVFYSICTFPQPNHCPCCCCCCPADVDVPALRAPEGWELSWPVSHTLHILIQLRCYTTACNWIKDYAKCWNYIISPKQLRINLTILSR